MLLFRNRWLSGVLLAAPLIALVPTLALIGPTAPAAPAVAPAMAQAQPSPAAAPAGPTPTSAPTAEPTPPPRPGMWASAEAPQTPILMYHYIREVDEAADPLGFRLSVRPDRFDEQLTWLHASGYVTLLMRELAACLRGELPCPPRAVALTFDDGTADQALAALPALQRHGFRATFYIITGFVGRDGYMSWEQLEALRDAGMEIGAHTVSHADLGALPLPEARAEISMAREELEQRLGIEVASFSYPSGSYAPAVARAVRAAGFTSAVTAAPDSSPRRLYELPRRRVLGGETIEGYPWYFVPLATAGE